MSAASGVFSGNVGIGTSSPSIYGSLTLTGDIFVNAVGSGGYGRIFANANQSVFSSNNYYNGTNDLSALSGYSPQLDLRIDDGSIRFKTSTTVAANTALSLSERMRITSSGNVGIGTTSPGSLLEVYSTSTTTPYVAARLSSEAAASGESFTWAKIEKGNGYGGAIGGYISQGIGSGLVLGTLNGSATITERMRITHTGNVGIGTTSPGFPLHISSSTSQNIATFNYSTAGGYSEIQVSSNDRSISLGQRSSTYPSGDLAYLYTPNATPFAIYTSAAERLRITSSGNVGIGTTSPAATLDVNGSLSISSMANYRSYSFSGNISSNTWYEVANRSNLSSGVWVVLVYMDTYSAGIGIYQVMYASVPFYYNNIAPNETNGLSYTLPTLYGSGHAINAYAAPSVRIRATPIATAQIYIEINFGSSAFTGLDGTTAGKILSVYFRKIA